MEQEKRLQELIPLEDFKEKVREMAVNNYQQLQDDLDNGILHLRDYRGVTKFKSIRRAIRRGHVSIFGDVYPGRPFKNISTKRNRNGKVVNVKTHTYIKKRLYEQLKHRNDKVS